MALSYTLKDNAGGKLTLAGAQVRAAIDLPVGKFPYVVTASESGWARDFSGTVTVAPPAWVTALTEPSVVTDFRRGRYFLPNLTAAQVSTATLAQLTDLREAAFEDCFVFTAASTTSRVYQDTTGKLRNDLAANAPRWDWEGSIRRLMLTGALTNKTTCRKHNPTDTTNITLGGNSAASATLTVVDDVAALAAAGLDLICTNGKVYKLDNSAGTDQSLASISGQTGSTNPHAVSAFVRGGTGFVTGSTQGEGAFAVPASSAYVYRSSQFTPGTTSRTMTIRANAGQVIYFILPGLYEQNFAPMYPIPGDTLSAVTRAIETCRFSPLLEAIMQRTEFTARVQAKDVRGSLGRILGSSGGLSRILGLNGGENSITAGSTNVPLGYPVTVPLPSFGAIVARGATDHALGYNGQSKSDASVLDSNRTEVYLGRDLGGTQYAVGRYETVSLWPIRRTNADIQTLAVSYAT